MTTANKYKNVGFLGEIYQAELVKYFIETPTFFKRIAHIVDQNMFGDEHLKRIVAYMKDYYQRNGGTSNYVSIEVHLRASINDEISLELALSKLKNLKSMVIQSQVEQLEDLSEKFFKQQNLVKALNRCGEILKRGDVEEYQAMEDILKEALNKTVERQMSWQLFDNIEDDLREDYRHAIPTGAKKLDDALYGGLGKGQLGIIISPLGTGKAQPLHSKLLTPNGFITMGEIAVGDEVIGCDGLPHKVTKIFEQGERNIYKVSFSDGTEVECDVEHLWNVKGDCGRIETKTLRDIIEDMDAIDTYVATIPTSKPIVFDVIDSYKGIDDSFMFKIGNDLTCQMNLDAQCYLSSISQRLNLVFGLARSGVVLSLNGKGKFEISNTAVSYDTIKSVILSLGGSVNKLGVVTLPIELANGIEQFHNYEVFIPLFGDVEDKRIIGVEQVEKSLAQCIMVDSEEHTYITDGFAVTHNTSCTTGFAANAACHRCEANFEKGYKVLHFYFEDTDVDIRRKYYGFMTNIDACDLSTAQFKENVIRVLNDEELPIRQLLRSNIRGVRLTSGEVSASDIKTLIDQHISVGFVPDLVVVDYFECLKPEKRTDNFQDNEWSREGVTMRKLESIAGEYNIALWVPVQSTKGAIGQEYVGVESGGGSVKKTQIGHIVIQLAQTPEQKVQGRLNMFIGKMRGLRVKQNEFKGIAFNNGTCKFDMGDDLQTAPTQTNRHQESDFDDVPF